MDNGTVLKD